MNRLKVLTPQLRQFSGQMRNPEIFWKSFSKGNMKFGRKNRRFMQRTLQRTRSYATRIASSESTEMWKRLGIGGAISAAAFFGLYQVLNTSAGRQALAGDSVKTMSPAVRDYIRGTYAYLFGGLMLTALTSVYSFRIGLAARIASMGPFAYLGIFGLGTLGILMLTNSLSPENVVGKNLGYMAFTIMQGIGLSTLGFLGGQPLIKAGIYTIAIFTAMTLVASMAKEETFLYLGGPLMAGLFVMIAASIVNMFVPNTTRVGFALNNFVIYGGLLLFVGFLLYDTQKMVYHGKLHAEQCRRMRPELRPRPDYVGEALHIYMDVLNIFIRLALIFGNQNRRSKGQELTMEEINEAELADSSVDQL